MKAAKFLHTRDPVKILKCFKHPLQPDVDLLVEDCKDGNKLSGFEIKIIRWKPDSIWRVAPRARLYAGLDQALTLTTYGLDYVCLWHIFTPSRTAYRKAFKEKGYKWAERLDDGWIEFTAAYSGIVRGVLANFNLPIGYIPTGLLIDPTADRPIDKISVGTGVLGVLRAPSALGPTETGTQIRTLLQKALG